MRSLYSFWRAVFVVLACITLAAPAFAQDDGPFSPAQLDQLLAPIALYPDSLLSQVLMASTYPSNVAEPARWSRYHSELDGDDAVLAVENRDWDPSVQSLVAFPQVLAMMGNNPEWVQDLGDAFLAQPDDVMDAVQRLRYWARRSGYLRSSNRLRVVI